MMLQPPKPEDVVTICYTSGTTGIMLSVTVILQYNDTVSMAILFFINSKFLLAVAQT